MDLQKSIVSKPKTILIIFIILVSLGLYSSRDLAVDLYPDIEIPTLLVMVNVPGSGPEEIEKRVTRVLEGSLTSVSGMKKISSTSSKGNSMIILRFNYGTNMDEAMNGVRDKLDLVKRALPDNAGTPIIFKFDPSSVPILYLSLGGNRSPEELRKIAEDFISPRLEQIDGVATVNISGGRNKIIKIEIEQNRLYAYNLSITDISKMLIGQNIQISAGTITEHNKNYLLQTSGEYSDIEQIKDTIIAYRGVAKVKLSDIANVYEGYENESNIVNLNGEKAIQILIQKQSGSNSVKTAENVLKNLPKIQKELPRGIDLEVIFDSTISIKASINEVINSAITGALLAIFILFIFLRDVRSVIIIGLSIPISIFITLLSMYIFGLTLNMMTLAGLALGIGMLVDNSIVILENIFKYREKGTKLETASIIGSKEMAMAITASTLTTICVFLPMVIFKSQLEIIGELMSALAFTIVISLGSSLVVALTLIPVLASHYLPIQSKFEKGYKLDKSGNLVKDNSFFYKIFKYLDNILEVFFNKMDESYKNILSKILNNKKYTIIAIIIIFVLSIILIPASGFQFMPTSEGDSVQINFDLPIGTKLEVTKDIANQLELIIEREVKGYKNIVSTIGLKSFMGFLGASESHKGRILITLPNYDERIDQASTIKEKLRKHFNDFPNVKFYFSSGGMGVGSSSPIDYIIKSNDLNKATETAKKIKKLIVDNVPEVAEPDIDIKDGLPQIEIKIDRDKAYSYGLSVYQIANEIKANIDGITSGKYRKDGNEYDIIITLNEKDKTSIMDLENVFIKTPQGLRIPLSNICFLEKTTGPVDIKRENQMRTVHLTAGLRQNAKLNEVISQINKLIDKNIPKDDSVIITVGGDFENLVNLGLKLLFILLISVFLIFSVMASQFESFIDPFIIMFTIPLMIIGVSIIYFFTGEQFSIFTGVGLVVLAGIVVNNGIVLVDYTNLLRKRGYSVFDACIEAGRSRLRPILMTTLTTILAVLPMAFSKGEGSSLSQPLAKTIFGGLTTSTIFTLFLVPVLYAIINKFTENMELKKKAKNIKFQELKREKILETINVE